MMKIHYSCFLLLCCVLFSCQDDKVQREAEQQRDVKKKELVFSEINKNWSFRTAPINAASQTMVSVWPAWRDLLRELSQKPQSSIGAFQKKARVLSVRAAELSKQIPPRYDKPEMRSRISVLITKINALNLFINLNQIPSQKVIVLISDINSELVSLQMQMDEFEKKSRIPTEEGESEMIRMLDTSRAVPTKSNNLIHPLEQSKTIR